MIDALARGLAAAAKALGAAAFPKAGGTLTGPITGTSNTIEQRNGASAQTYNLYGTYTDASNYTRVALTVGGIVSQSAGTGGAVTFDFGTGAGNNGSIFANVNNARVWNFTAAAIIGQTAGQYIKTPGTTVALLTAAATAGAGARAYVTDATAPTFGATVAGGGAVGTPVYSDGTNWKVG